MVTEISTATRTEVLGAIRSRYREASKRDKSRMLDEFVALTGCHRKHAVRLIGLSERSTGRSVPKGRRIYPNPPPKPNPTSDSVANSALNTGNYLSPQQVKGRVVGNDQFSYETHPHHQLGGGSAIYDEAVRQALIVVWEASDRICGKRLKAALPSMVQSLERHGHLDLAPDVRERLFSASASSMDRLLRPVRESAGSRRRLKRRRKMGSRVPVCTFMDWNEPGPGYLEIDLVSHGGGAVSGAYIHSLVATDISSGWTEAVLLLAREQSLVVEGLEAISGVFPVPVRGIDSDNDSVFINETLVGYCEERDRVHPLQGVPQERPGVDRAEERLGDPTLRRTRAPLRSGRRPDDGPPLRCCASVRELLPTVIPATGQEPEWWQRDQALQQAGHTLRPATRS